MKLALALLLFSSTAVAEPLPLWTLEAHYAPSDTQRTLFVLYDDGRVIWSTKKKPEEKGAGYTTAQLDAVARETLMKALPTAESFAKIPEFVDAAPSATDGVSNVICRFAAAKRCIIVHGFPKDLPSAPADLVQLYERLTHYTNLDAKPWSPDTVEVRLYPAKPHGMAKPWPTKWNATMVPHHDPGAEYWTTTIPGADLKELQATVDEHKQLSFGVQRRDASYTVRLPSEDRWRR